MGIKKMQLAHQVSKGPLFIVFLDCKKDDVSLLDSLSLNSSGHDLSSAGSSPASSHQKPNPSLPSSPRWRQRPLPHHLQSHHRGSSSSLGSTLHLLHPSSQHRRSSITVNSSSATIEPRLPLSSLTLVVPPSPLTFLISFPPAPSNFTVGPATLLSLSFIKTISATIHNIVGLPPPSNSSSDSSSPTNLHLFSTNSRHLRRPPSSPSSSSIEPSTSDPPVRH